MDFTLSPELEELRVRTRTFIEDVVLPLEADPENFSEDENIPLGRLAPVQERAKKIGFWSPLLARFLREEGRDFWSWSAGNKI